VARRSVGLFPKAGSKYRPTRNPEPTTDALSATIGMGTAHLDGRMRVKREDLLYHAGNLASRTRSAERLRAMLEAETGRKVEIEEFAGGYIRLPESEQTRMPRGRYFSTLAAGRLNWCSCGATPGPRCALRAISKAGPRCRLASSASRSGMVDAPCRGHSSMRWSMKSRIT
jgi:hypothetical protein